jgi:hypothetical protein
MLTSNVFHFRAVTDIFRLVMETGSKRYILAPHLRSRRAPVGLEPPASGIEFADDDLPTHREIQKLSLTADTTLDAVALFQDLFLLRSSLQ